MLMWIEAGLALLLVILALVCPGWGARTFDALGRRFSNLARRPRLSVLVVALLALVARAAVLPILPEPQPYMADEFSFLLAADTFAHGRLANPPNPMWIHFENVHIIQQPTYASMYPPAQGLMLAFGQVATGHPFVGVCLSVALLCAAVCWMLQGWMPRSWALLGGLFAVMHFGVFSYWANSYWGGALAGIGGTLVLGALPRLKRSQRFGDALLMGLGAAILANSRPYEGFVFCLPVAVTLVWWIWRGPHPLLAALVRRVFLPLALMLGVAAVLTGYYYWRVTGSPFRMGYQVNRATYAVAPYFQWQSSRPEPVYRHPIMRDFYIHNELGFYLRTRGAMGILAATVVKLIHLWMFYLGPLLTLPFVMLVPTLPLGFSWQSISCETRFLITAAGVSLAGLSCEVFFFPHYAAPMTCLVFALLLLALRRLQDWQWRGRASGRFITRALPVACALMLGLRAAAAPLHLPLTPDWPPTGYNSRVLKTERPRVLTRLEALPGKHLVIVHYAPNSTAPYGWVYNLADLDHTKVVWAVDMGEAQNRKLIDYFADRKVWVLDPDEHPPKLSPYSLLSR